MNVGKSLWALYQTSVGDLFGYGDIAGVAVAENLSLIRFLGIGLLLKRFLFKSDFGLKVVEGRSKKFHIPQSVVGPIYHDGALVSLALEPYPTTINNFTGRPEKLIILGEQKNFTIRGMVRTSIAIVDSILDAIVCIKHAGWGINVIATLGQDLDSDSIKMLETGSSAVFFVNEGDQTRLDQFWRLKSRFKHLVPCPILDSQNLYDSARAKQSIDFAIGRGIYQSSNALTGKNIEKPVAIERGGGQKVGDFNYWLGNYARKIQGGCA